jgi:uncharacterized integral membrane protein
MTQPQSTNPTTTTPLSTDEVPLKVERTRISATWVAVAVAVVFLLLLIIFIAQNNRQVPVHFLWITGHVSESVALVMAALAGAVLVLAVGAARIIQLRVVGRRHNQQVRKNQAAAVAQQPAPSVGVGAAPQGVPDAVETHQ